MRYIRGKFLARTWGDNVVIDVYLSRKPGWIILRYVDVDNEGLVVVINKNHLNNKTLIAIGLKKE